MRGGLAERIRARGAELGFERIGFSAAGPSPRSEALRRWVAQGYAGSMAYMEQDVEGRADPTRRSPWARTVVSAAVHYAPPPAAGAAGSAGPGIVPLVSSYAVGDDYHDVLRRKLGELARFIREDAGGRAEARALVDTSAVLERDIGSLGGIGWTGKNAMLIDPESGSYFFLGEVLTSVEIEPGAEIGDLCGTCTACIEACPTQAMVGPRVVDSRRCISYLTIERRGAIPRDLREAVGAHLSGATSARRSAPWNRRAPSGQCEAFEPASAMTETTLEEAVGFDDRSFAERFRRTSLARAHRPGFVRNALLVAANTRNGAALAAGAARLADQDPSVRETAVWALARGEDPERRLAREAAESEADAALRARMLADVEDATG